jgi:succinate dehydrogenase/fumarate reductase flavoprotein subunit
MFEADVIVIGGGGSGLAAAATAAKLGRSVILLEKNAKPGGTTALSVGSISATNTPLQLNNRIKDSPKAHFEDMALFAGPLAGRDNPGLRRILTDNVTDTVNWLMSLGVEFFGPMPEPPHRLPRMHNVLPNSRAYIYCLKKECARRGVQMRFERRVVSLLRDGARVCGVEAKNPSGDVENYRARNGVILATGDYSGSKEFKAKYISPNVAEIEAINVTNTGDGHRMALELGGRIINGDLLLGPEIRFAAPQRDTLLKRLPISRLVAKAIRLSIEWLPAPILRPFIMSFVTTALAPTPKIFNEGGILVNRQGKRFTDELTRDAAVDLSRQPGKEAFIVFDSRLAELFSAAPNYISTAPGVAYAYLPDYRRNRRDIFHTAPTLPDLAAKLGMPPAEIMETVAQYNLKTASGERRTIAEGPFYALGPVRSWVIFTDGGLAITDRLEVQGQDGKPIPGLYAVGATGQGGLILEGHGHHLGWAFTSGRIAGRNAALNE